jgi:hypothetical protein
VPDRPTFRYGDFGNPIPLCPECGKDMDRYCKACAFPQFTMLGGMRMLALGLLGHYGVDRSWSDADVAELEQVIGDELLDLGREFIEEKRLERVDA